MQNHILDEILVGLADDFESGNRNIRSLKPSSIEEYEPLRECLATLIAEGSLDDFQSSASYRLTPSGYAKYKPLINALRALPRAEQRKKISQSVAVLADPKATEEERKLQIVREVLARFDASDKDVFRFIYDNGEISIKALAFTRKFGKNLYQVLDRAARTNLLKKQVYSGQTFYSINPELRSAVGYLVATETGSGD